MPYRLGHEVIFEADEIVHGLLLRRKLRDVVRLEAVDELAEVVGLAFNGTQYGSVSNRTIRAQEYEIVGEIRCSDAEVGLCFLLPDILEVGARGIDDGEAGLERGVETRGADEHVDGIFFAVVAYAPAFRDGVDLAVDDFDVFFAEGFEVSDAWSQASTTDMPVGNQALLKIWVLKFVVHLLAEVRFGVAVCICVFEKDAKLAVEAALDVLAVVDEDIGFGGEIETFRVGEDVLFEPLHGGYPGWFSDEGGHLGDMGLNGGEDLDARGAEHESVYD